GKTNLFRLINYVLVALNPHKRIDSEEYLKWGSESFEINVSVELTDKEKNYITDYLICSALSDIMAINATSDENNIRYRLHYIDYIANYGETIFGTLKNNLTFNIKWNKIYYNPEINLKMTFGEHEFTVKNQLMTIDMALDSQNKKYFSVYNIIFEELQKFSLDIKDHDTKRLLGEHYKPPSLDKFFDPTTYKNGGTSLHIPEISSNIQNLSQNLDEIKAITIQNKLTSIEKLCNLDIARQQIDIKNIAYSIFARSLVLVSNPRYSIDDVKINFSRGESLSTDSFTNLGGADQNSTLEIKPENIIELLFGMRNSINLEDQSVFENIAEAFYRLTGFKLDVGIITEDDKKTKKLILRFVDNNNNIMNYQAVPSGVLEILLLVVALSQKEKIILLDEPALNLHPIKQQELLKEIQNQSSPPISQLIIITHSPYIIDKSLEKVTRFDKSGDSTRYYLVNADELKPFENNPTLIESLINCLFAKAVIIGEGIHEVYALNIWLNKKKFEMADIELINGGGIGNLPKLTEILNAWGIFNVTFSDKKGSGKLNPDNSIIYEYDDIAGLLESQPKFQDISKKCKYTHKNKETITKRQKNHIHLEEVICLAENMDPPKEVDSLINKLKQR
ncbi:MAG: ATP-dependent nuclease, partial [Caldisphaera sp.]